MADLSKLSDADLEALQKKDLSKLSDEGLQHLSGASSAAPEGGGFGTKVKGALGSAARGLDYAFGAAPRAAIGAVQQGQNPLLAFVTQYGKPPEAAPTGQELASGFGVPNEDKNLGPILRFDPKNPNFYKIGGQTNPEMTGGYEDFKVNPAKVAGAGIEAAANILNVVPGVGLATKAGTRAAEAVSEASPLLRGMAKSAGSVIEGAAELPGGAAKYVASEVTGVPKNAISTYAQRGDQVKDLISKTGGELSVAADEMKGNILDSIGKTKKGLSDQITADLAQNPVRVPAQPIIEKLQAAKAKLNPHYSPGDIAQIDEMINAVNNTARDGTLSAQELFDTKKYLQTRGQGAYVKDGQLFSSGDKAQAAAKSAGGVARETLHEASPAIKHADSIFEHLHDLDDKMSASLLGQGKSENIFAAAGGGKGNIYQTQLRQIGEITGTNPLKDAELLYAAKQFKDPSIATRALKAGLDLKRRTYDAIPSGAPSGIDNALQLLNNPSLNATYADNAASRRMSSLKK